MKATIVTPATSTPAAAIPAAARKHQPMDHCTTVTSPNATTVTKTAQTMNAPKPQMVNSEHRDIGREISGN